MTPLLAMQIVDLQFEGNNICSREELEAVMISYQGMEYNQLILLEDMNRIADLYEQKGYYLAKIGEPEVVALSQAEVSIIVRIDEGSDLQVQKVSFTGNNYITTDKLLDEIKTPLIFLRDLPQYMKELVEYYNQQSFYFADAKVDEIMMKDNQVEIRIVIEEGEYCRFSKSVIRGNKVTRQQTILQLSRLNGLETPSPYQLKQAEQNILSRPYIKTCRILPMNPYTLLYDVTEGNMTAFSGVVGYDNGNDNEGRFTGYMDVNFENLWGTDRSVGFFWENRQEQHSAIELNYHESGWDYPLGADIKLYREEMDSTWIEVSYDLELYWFDLFNQSGIYLQKQDIYAGSRRPVIIDETAFSKAGVFWRYTNMDHPSNPRTGYAWALKYYYIWSRTDEENSGRQAAETNYHKLIPLKGRWVGSIELNYNFIENKGLTEFDKFEVGGVNSIRGFLEQQYSGFRVGWTNLELRYILSNEARLSINVDVGNIENLENENVTIYSIGCGLRTNTPLGQLILDFAVPNDTHGFKNPLEGIIHFGLETRF